MMKKNLNAVRGKIADACERVGRDVESVHLIAVSKTKPVERLQEAYDLGCRLFGENKVQEIIDKYDKLPHDIQWHMIGHLQTNKIKYIIDKVAMIHSVDSYHLAEAIDREAKKHDLVMNILIEVNVAGEETKFGVSPSETVELVRQIAKLSNVKICGLMTIAPYVDNSEENRQYFVKLRELCVDINNENIDNINIHELSMGMSGDYEVAVEEGATFVRVGTSIFGERDYSK